MFQLLLAVRSYWQQQLERCHRERGFEHARFHGMTIIYHMLKDGREYCDLGADYFDSL